MTQGTPIVLRTSSQDSVFIDHDIRVTEEDLIQMYEKGKRFLNSIGGKMMATHKPLGPQEWVEEGIIAAPVYEEIYRIGDCLIRNSLYPTGFEASHEFAVLGRKEDVDKMMESLRRVAEIKNPWYEAGHVIPSVIDTTQTIGKIEGPFNPEKYLEGIIRIQKSITQERVRT